MPLLRDHLNQVHLDRQRDADVFCKYQIAAIPRTATWKGEERHCAIMARRILHPQFQCTYSRGKM